LLVEIYFCAEPACRAEGKEEEAVPIFNDQCERRRNTAGTRSQFLRSGPNRSGPFSLSLVLALLKPTFLFSALLDGQVVFTYNNAERADANRFARVSFVLLPPLFLSSTLLVSLFKLLFAVQFQHLIPIETALGKTRRSISSTTNTEALRKKEVFESCEVEAVVFYEPEYSLFGEEKLERVPCDSVGSFFVFLLSFHCSLILFFFLFFFSLSPDNPLHTRGCRA
jgi:hypothetical protein